MRTLTVENEAFRRQLERDALWHRMVSPGDRLPDTALVEVDLGPIHLDRLRDTGPVVLLFFRYASSTACDVALRDYQRTLLPALAARNAHLVAVSPQVPGRLEAVKRRHDLGYLVASDARHGLIDAFNIGFHNPGADVVLGARRSMLPFATAVVADRTGRIRYAEVRADWTDPIDPATIIAAVPHV